MGTLQDTIFFPTPSSPLHLLFGLAVVPTYSWGSPGSSFRAPSVVPLRALLPHSTIKEAK
jgi:hypothetical protein